MDVTKRWARARLERAERKVSADAPSAQAEAEAPNERAAKGVVAGDFALPKAGATLLPNSMAAVELSEACARAGRKAAALARLVLGVVC